MGTPVGYLGGTWGLPDKINPDPQTKPKPFTCLYIYIYMHIWGLILSSEITGLFERCLLRASWVDIHSIPRKAQKV